MRPSLTFGAWKHTKISFQNIKMLSPMLRTVIRGLVLHCKGEEFLYICMVP